MKHMKKELVAGLTIMMLVVTPVAGVFATGGSYGGVTQNQSHKFDQDTICHKKSDGSFEKVLVSPDSLAPHFNRDGTPQTGHEHDTLLEGDQDCPTSGGSGGGGTTPTPTPSPSGGSGSVCVKPTDITSLTIDTGVLNDHKMMISWQGGTGADSVNVYYGTDQHALGQLASAPNTGSY